MEGFDHLMRFDSILALRKNSTEASLKAGDTPCDENVSSSPHLVSWQSTLFCVQVFKLVLLMQWDRVFCPA